MVEKFLLRLALGHRSLSCLRNSSQSCVLNLHEGQDALIGYRNSNELTDKYLNVE